MSLSYAILGLLTYEPMSGYTLKTRYFDRSVAHFWPADQSQIYRTLQALERDGSVEGHHAIVNDNRPKSRVYHITKSGREALRGWLAASQPLGVDRDSFLLQLYFSRLLTREQVLTVLKARRAEHVRQLAYFNVLELPDAHTDEMRRQIIFGEMTLDFGRRNERMKIDWIDACIEKISAMDDIDFEPR